MDDSSQPSNSWQQASRTYTRSVRWLALIAGCFVLLLGLVLQAYGFSPADTAYSAPMTQAGNNPTATPTATATQAATPPSLALAVPSSGQGPVGAHLTLTGSNWGTTDVLVGVASPGASCADPNSWTQTFNQVRPQADQSIIFTFVWPASLSNSSGPYSVCASNSAGVANTSYQVVSASPPALTLDPITTHAGSLVKVTGQNFFGSGAVTLSITDAQGNSRNLTTLSPDGNGAFTLTFQPRPTDVGDLTMHAVTSAPQGMRPALQADAKLHVDVALTPTPGVTPTTAVVAPPKPAEGGGSSNPLLIVALVVGILLALVVVAGAVFFVVMRSRANPAGGPGAYGSGPGYGGGSGPGYGGQGAMYGDTYQGSSLGGVAGMGGLNDESWDAPTQAGYSPYEQGGYPPQPGYGANDGGWRDPDQPDPTWRPRPMTGQWRASETYGDDPYGNDDDYSNYGADDTGRNPPRDPWGPPDASAGQPKRPSGTGQRYDGGYPPATPGDYPPPGPRSRGSGGSPGRGSSGGQRDTGGRDRYPDQPPGDDW